MTTRIEDYAIIGDCRSAALVSRNGSIDWLCWPRFASSAVFAAILGEADNGRWSIRAEDPTCRIHRKYLDNTLILETTFETHGGAVSVIDFMPLGKGEGRIVRLVRGRRGSVDMVAELTLRFDYGSIVPWVTRLDGGGIKAVAGPDMIVVHGCAELAPEDFKHIGRFTVNEGDEFSFVLSYGNSFGPLPEPINPVEAFRATKAAWREWASNYTGSGPYREAALRSLLTLKALTYSPTGGIVAAATTSLPEKLGGERNWDYRYCWLRDATFTLLALMNSGFYQEADAWRTWLRQAVAGKPEQVQIMYGLGGERRLDEWQVPWLAGYEGSKPVRIGNAAAKQLQIDIYGEVMDALYQGSLHGLSSNHGSWSLQVKLIEHLETIWRDPDEGIWEVRSGPRHFTHSKVMAWVAMDRAIKSAERFGFEAPLEKWRTLCGQIHKQVCEEGYNSKVGSFVQSYGSTALDASALLIPLVGFLPPDDPRVQTTVAAISAHLMKDGLLRRYDLNETADGVVGGEGAFLACSFWLADNLALLGRRSEATELFEFLLSLRNDVGLLAEEYDPSSKRMLGNFPQAFSHVALVNTAHNLSEIEKPAEQRREA